MLIAHIGDIHLGLNYPGPTPEARFDDIVRVMDWCADRIIEERCEMVLVAGDLFKDARVYLDRADRAIITVSRWIRRFTDEGMQVVIISGTPSHDAISAYRLLREMVNPNYCRIYTEPTTVQMPNVGIACLPGMNRASLAAKEEYRNMSAIELHELMTQRITEASQQMLKDLDRTVSTILLGHLTYDLADKGFEDVLMQHEPVLTQEAIEGYDMVCLGHIHRPQRNGDVFYCGSPERLNFNDEEVTPGFIIHDISDGASTARLQSKFVETPARKYKTLRFDAGCIESLSKYGMTYFGSSIANDVADAIVRLYYECPEAVAKQLDKKALEKALYDAGAFFVAEIIGSAVEGVRDREQEVTTEMGVLEALQKWCEQPEMNIDADEIPHLLAMAEELMGGAA